MTRARLPWYGLALLVVLAVAYALAYLGLVLCSPAALPGDESWVRWMRLGQAIDIVGGLSERCFYRDEAKLGGWSLALASWGGRAVIAVILAALAWETLGRGLRNSVRRRHGGHAILAGEPEEVEPLAATAAKAKAVVYLARNPMAGYTIARRHPFSEVAVLNDRSKAAEAISRLGSSKAALVAAVTGNDLANGEIAEAALADGGSGDVIVRLEQTSVRALKSDSLRRMAEKEKRALTVISLRQMQARAGLHHAMPGRYCDDRAGRVHITVCGAGPLLQEITFQVVRQGYGLERAPPLISILRTGRSDFAAGALELLRQSGVAEVHQATADGADAVAIDRAFTAIALRDGLPLAAVYCCEEEAGAAVNLARRIERVMVDLEIPVPPIVVNGEGDAPGDTGMIRIARPPDLAGAHRQAALLDQRAMGFHAAYLDGQKLASGDRFGRLPAERPWDQLPEENRDDNRHSADHIDYKLARIGCVAVRHPAGPSFTESDVEMLARMEHARWMASRGLRGFRYGPERDNTLLFHPDMKPYDALDADAQRKDRDQVRTVPVQLAAAGEVPGRLSPLGFLSAKASAGVLERLKPVGRAGALEVPLVSVAIEGEDAVTVAERALALGFHIEAFVRKMPEHVFSDRALRQRAAAVLRQAWRIRAVYDGTARDALVANCKVVVDVEGNVDEATLA